MQVKNKKTMEIIVKVLDEYWTQFGKSPALSEIAERSGVSVATVSRYVQTLIDKGQVVRRGKFCALSTNNTMHGAVVRSFPVVGDIACGVPILASQNIESYVSMSDSLVGAGEFFFLRAQGDSMIGAGINDGDLVLIKRQNAAEDGQIVVALTDDETATLKRYFVDKENKRIRLHPENESMSDMFFENVSVQGVAVKVLKNL